MGRSVIVSAVRTPFGKLGGGLVDYEATQLGSLAIRAALERVGLEPREIEYVIMGQVLQGGAGQAPARQASIGAGLPIDVGSDTINKVCASSTRGRGATRLTRSSQGCSLSSIRRGRRRPATRPA